MKSLCVCTVFMAFVFSLVSTLVTAAELSPNDLRPRVYQSRTGLTMEQRLTLLHELRSNGQKYLASLEAASWKDFESTNKSGGIVAALVTELEDVKVLIKDFMRRINYLENNLEDYESWLMLVRNYYLVAPYMDDLDNRGIVKSDAYIGLRLWLPFVFDGILLQFHCRP